ncbi:MAG: tRNA lysidine(34) synthetase TilS [Stellaceae bacterium]
MTEASFSKPLTYAEFSAAIGSLARFEDKPFVAVAVSGGPDSLALTLLGDRWVRDRGGEICALTVDHRLRPESGDEIRQLTSWLSGRAIRHEVLVWAEERPLSGIQEAARIARYRLLAGWCRGHGCLHLLTAHHREDQVETHLIRRRASSGADGLAGMSAIRELDSCRVLRPLLGVPKARLAAFLEAERQPFILDPSNLNPAFERSHLRLAGRADATDLLLEIRKLGDRRIEREREGNALLARYVSLHPAGFAILDPAVLLVVSRETTERLLSSLVAAIGGASYPARRERIARLWDALARMRRGYALGGCRFVWWRGRVLVMRELARAAQPIGLASGESAIWDRRFKIVVPSRANYRFTIGYLGVYGVHRLSRLTMPSEADHRLPRLIFPELPAIWDENGIAAIPHIGYRREGAGALPQVSLRSVNPLTQAGFAVV